MCLPGLNVLSIFEIVFYSPAVFVSVFLCKRHSFSPNAGFIFLFFFSLLRITGAALDLATIQNPDRKGVLDTVALAASFTGVSPLLLTALGLLYSIRFRMIKIYPTAIKPYHLVLLRVPVMAALVLCDKGAVAYGLIRAKTGAHTIDILSMVGTMIFMVVVVGTAAVTSMLLTLRFRFEKTQQRLLYTVTASLPFLFARVLYSFLGAFTFIDAFRFLDGSLAVMGCMSILPEMIVVIMYVGVGFLIPPITKIIEPPKPKKEKKDKKSKPIKGKSKRVKIWRRSSKDKNVKVEVRAADDDDLDRSSTIGTVDGRNPELKPKKSFRVSKLNGPLGDRSLGLETPPNHSSMDINDVDNHRASTQVNYNGSRPDLKSQKSYRTSRLNGPLGDRNHDLERASRTFPQIDSSDDEVDDHRSSTRVNVNGSRPELKPERSYRKSGVNGLLGDIELDKHASVDLSQLYAAQIGRAT